MNDRFDNWDKFIDPRIDKLESNGFYLEAFYLCSATMEHLLQTCISTQEVWIISLLRKNKVKFTPFLQDQLTEKTLGELIKIFSKYCDDESLISELNNFNSFRKTLVHKLLDQDVNKLNNDAKLKLITYNKLVSSISRYGYEISKKQIRSSKRQIRILRKKIDKKYQHPNN